MALAATARSLGSLDMAAEAGQLALQAAEAVLKLSEQVAAHAARSLSALALAALAARIASALSLAALAVRIASALALAATLVPAIASSLGAVPGGLVLHLDQVSARGAIRNPHRTNNQESAVH